MNGNPKRQFWMNKTFLDVTNSVVPQTTAEALVSSETPPPVTTLTLFPVTAAARSSNTPHCEDHVHRKLTYIISLCWNFWITVTQFLISSCFWWEWEVNSLWKQPKKQNITVLCLWNIWTKKKVHTWQTQVNKLSSHWVDLDVVQARLWILPVLSLLS